jgi:hypothetical protein
MADKPPPLDYGRKSRKPHPLLTLTVMLLGVVIGFITSYVLIRLLRA